ETAQVRFAQGETAPALRVEITQTPSKIVFTALVPGDGGTSVAIEEVARMSAGIETNHGSRISLEKELLRRQEGRILSAVLAAPGDSGAKRLAVLTGEALEVYSGGPEDWKLDYAKPLPGPRPAERSLHGQLLVTEQAGGRMGILLPGRRCEASLGDQAAIACSSATVEWPSGRLLALPGCGKEPWWLKSDSVDWTSDDRLLLRSAGAGKEQPFAAELRFPGPVVSIGAGDSAASATVVTRDLSSGNYEVYRIALVCGG
ncbi:MAG TPA: hypothetical protein VKB24_01845, partial [Candidatus Acidoferrum sp.]|nr:hypothetical protein [Candidatus Acidoferrum sp.]